MYYNLDGIPSKSPRNDDFYIYKGFDKYVFKDGGLTDDIENNLQLKYSILKSKIFDSEKNFNSKLYLQLLNVSSDGIDAESVISKKDFEKLLNIEKGDTTHKLLYYYDCANLIGSLQNLNIESSFLFGDFYKVLNENSFMLQSKPFSPNDTMYASGLLVVEIFSKINHLFINLCSQFDFITKLIYEFSNIQTNFSEYPKLKSKNVLYGDYKKLGLKDINDTIYDKSQYINLIVSLRNEIIHNSSFENIPKVYQNFKDDILIEKFILIPDTTNGIFDTYKNRNRFFSSENKLNELLPKIYFEFQKKVLKTISLIQ